MYSWSYPVGFLFQQQFPLLAFQLQPWMSGQSLLLHHVGVFEVYRTRIEVEVSGIQSLLLTNLLLILTEFIIMLRVVLLISPPRWRAL